MPVKVRVLETERVFRLVIVNVPVELVMVRPLIEVAVAAPIFGVVKLGLSKKAKVFLAASSNRGVVGVG